jgi:hypothetical protein
VGWQGVKTGEEMLNVSIWRCMTDDSSLREEATAAILPVGLVGMGVTSVIFGFEYVIEVHELRQILTSRCAQRDRDLLWVRAFFVERVVVDKSISECAV